ncbi:dTDP-4-dehydrorhamnose 3,5-epimerase [Saccharicrinis fermentans]|uniref:dTDP-4-dehydrorhamnose 3,5-epimerase n=1 Tax=Saccharicrinis fermentans DSM 9555 = JCM 21142 TaxID=869213 RepID=W7YNW2_9BACT|nr:dTDP-4-dehydrorhamnose 3,5-epimerase [Saccharicrinis fermentans]GAF04064.1 dTDP-4-dehydrorhamnose 3,5-epimerase [Saccharicrinis fermentans DSM 9555 = JCM 21142]
MEVIQTEIQDLLIIKPKKFNDARGFFLESYNKERFLSKGMNYDFVQDNFSSSQYGVIRGLHYQLAPYSQAKMVQAIKGKIIDVVVDLRKESPSFGKSFSIELSEENGLQLMIPRGFAHGFSVLSQEVLFSYKCDNLYNKDAERGIRFNDPFLGIDWRVPESDAIVSDKDQNHPLFKDAAYNF